MLMEQEADLKSVKKLSQFYGVVKRNEHHEALYWAIDKQQMNKELEMIIEQDGDVNYQFPNDHFITLRNPELIGCTALHLTVGQKNETITRVLLEHAALFTVKNSAGLTALHAAVEKYYDVYKDRWRLKGKLENTIVNLILSAHIDFEVFDNPCDKNGISHFHVACMANHSSAVEFFIKAGISIEDAVNMDSSVFPGYTPLHFAVRCCALETTEILIKNGAELNLKDARGMTPIDLLLEQNMGIVDLIHTVDNAISAWHYQVHKLMSDVETNKQIMELLIQYMVSLSIPMEFDVAGLTQFHVSSTLQNVSWIEDFSRQIEDVNHFVKFDSPFWPGYTALHFAAHFDIEKVKFLIQNGAFLEVEDANGLSPFDICIERYKIEDLHFILSCNSVWKSILLSDGKTKLLDIVSAMKNADALENFFKKIESNDDLQVPFDSPLWPGCTPVHLAITFSQRVKIMSVCAQEQALTKKNFEELENEYVDRINVCLKYDADVTIPDARGWTAIHLAYRMQKAKVVKLLLQEHTKIVNPIDRDNLSHLYIACAFNYHRLVKKILATNDTNVNVKIESTFRWCQNQKYFARRNSEEPHFYVTAGSTPLHIAVTCETQELVRTLLEHGADVNARDSNGVTPLHRTLACKNPGKVGNIFLSLPNLEECTLCELNYLHLAANFGSDESVIIRLIRLGADINSAIKFKIEAEDSSNMVVGWESHHLAEPFSFMSKFNNIRPIDIGIRRNHRLVVSTLLQRGLEIFSIRPDGWTVLLGALRGWYCDDLVLRMLKRDVALQKRMQEEWGITMLHVACKDWDLDSVRYFLKNGADVNAKVNSNCPLWPGCTPLHVLALQAGRERSEDKIIAVMQLLLMNGADVTFINSEQDTPLHLTEIGWDSISYSFYAHLPFTDLLLKSLNNFNINPTNIHCISLFHIACLRSDLNIMEKFLKCNTNVNQFISFCSSKFAGCTPLHLVLDPDSLVHNDLRVEAIDLLLRYGADIHAQDLYACTVLHKAVKCNSPRNRIFEKLVSAGIDINVNNVFGEKPLGTLLNSNNFEYQDIRFFVKHGCHINMFDSIREEGYLSVFFTRNHRQQFGFENPMLKRIIKTPGITKLDDFGRNAIHNVVSVQYAYIKDYPDVINLLIKHGCDIDQQDDLGRTALHYAVKFENYEAVAGLMKIGADINITDACGRTAFSYAFSFSKTLVWHQFVFQFGRIFRAFAVHTRKLQIVGHYVSDINKQTLDEVLKKWTFDERKIKRAINELKRMQDLKIGSTVFSPYNFLSETRAIAVFSDMPLSERRAIHNFFKSIKKCEFNQLGYLLKISYEKGLKRLSLVK